MPPLSEAQRKWVNDFLGKSGNGAAAPILPDTVDRAKVRPTLINVDDLKDNPNVKPDSPDLRHATPRSMVKVIDLDQGKQYEVTAEQVTAFRKSPDFIDNFKLLRAQPDWMELKVKNIEFVYESGKKFLVAMDDVNHGVNHNAQFYGIKGGIYYPRDANGKLLVDAAATPHVVGGKEWIDKEIARRKQQREEIAWIVYTFAGAVASLGGAAGGGKGGNMPVPRPLGRKPLPTSTPHRGGAPPRPPGGNTGGGNTGGGNQSGGTPTPKPAKAFPGRRAPTQDALRPKPELDANGRKGMEKANQDMKRSHTDPDGVWNQEAFKSNPKLKTNLDSFVAAKKPGDKGFSVKNLDVTNKKPEQLHQELQAKGFEYHREPLMAFEKDGVKHYRLRQARWEKNGKPVREGTPGAELQKTTTNKDDKDIVPHDIYQHPDGGLVRVKPEGDPNGKRSGPQVSKSVLNDPKDGTAFDNEMFKVTNDGKPVPKMPSKDWGMKQGPRGSSGKQEDDGYIDGIMGAAHPDLKF